MSNDQYDQAIELLRAMELGCAVNQECTADEEDSHYRWTNSRDQELGR